MSFFFFIGSMKFFHEIFEINFELYKKKFINFIFYFLYFLIFYVMILQLKKIIHKKAFKKGVQFHKKNDTLSKIYKNKNLKNNNKKKTKSLFFN